MYSLFIDTHDMDLIIGLYKEDKMLDYKIKESIRNHSDYTMELIKNILESNNLTVKDLKEILVINGPGSFTGVRIGVTIAKMLGYTLNIPVKTMDSITMYAISDNYNDKKIVLIDDVKGSYGGLFFKNELQGELFYKSKKELEVYLEEENIDYIVENKVDFNNIKKKFNETKPTLCHLVNPTYVKVIEALKWFVTIIKMTTNL